MRLAVEYEWFLFRVSRRLASYVYAGQGPIRSLATLSRTSEPLLALMTADQPLLTLVVRPPLAEALVLPTIMGRLTVTPASTEEAGDHGRPSLHLRVTPTERVGVPEGDTGLPSQLTIPAEHGSRQVPKPTAWAALPARETRLTELELQRVAGEPRIVERSGDAKQLRTQGLKVWQGPAAHQAPLAHMPPANAASATLIEVLSQRLPMQTRSDPQALGSSPPAQTRSVLERSRSSPKSQHRLTPEDANRGKQLRLPSIRPNPIRSSGATSFTRPIDQTLPALVRRGFAQPINGAAAPRALLLRLVTENTVFRAELAAMLGNSSWSVAASSSAGELTEPLVAVPSSPGRASQEQRVRGSVTVATSEIFSTYMRSGVTQGESPPKWTGEGGVRRRVSPRSRHELLSLGPPLGPLGAAAVLQPLVTALSRSHQSARPSSTVEVLPPETRASPAVQNTFNVTVHIAGGFEDETELADRIARILVDQARRHGIDVA